MKSSTVCRREPVLDRTPSLMHETARSLAQRWPENDRSRHDRGGSTPSPGIGVATPASGALPNARPQAPGADIGGDDSAMRVLSQSWRSMRDDDECFAGHDGSSVAGRCVGATRAGSASGWSRSAPRSSCKPRVALGAERRERRDTAGAVSRARGWAWRHVLANEAFSELHAWTGPVPRAGTGPPRSLLFSSFSLHCGLRAQLGPEGPCRFASRRSSRLAFSPA
ncbi:hypothetical protein SAMN05421783_104226 [Thiocapsa roseopersicina]|uniref:Uncharacterized protein n=1 Tax=Thiocapsa roseopersicina TaxID=1058 RepID=A0A1H2TYD9_THIRO|nr:hypothetical protein SAMN05421783_104226 [Thiocapsa roseopersicina]